MKNEHFNPHSRRYTFISATHYDNKSMVTEFSYVGDRCKWNVIQTITRLEIRDRVQCFFGTELFHDVIEREKMWKKNGSACMREEN